MTRVRTTMRPHLEVDVDQAEYDCLKAWGLLLPEGPVVTKKPRVAVKAPVSTDSAPSDNEEQ